jgi:hypothetical protein
MSEIDLIRDDDTPQMVESSPPRFEMLVARRMNIASIRADWEVSCRVDLDRQAISDYSAMRRAGSPYPAIAVMADGNWLADGWARLQSARDEGDTEIDVYLYAGGRTEALMYAARHHIRRTPHPCRPGESGEAGTAGPRVAAQLRQLGRRTGWFGPQDRSEDSESTGDFPGRPGEVQGRKVPPCQSCLQSSRATAGPANSRASTSTNGCE